MKYNTLFIGSKIQLSAPMGKGYQVEEYFEKYKNDFPTTNIYLLAAGR
jgi:hypothetical protein